MISLKRLREQLKRLTQSRDGAAIVELAILLPVIAGMVIPLVDLGMGAYSEMQLQNAVQAAAGTALTQGFNASTINASVNANVTAAASSTPGSLSALTIATPTQQCGCVTSTNTIVFSNNQIPPNCNPPCPTGGIGVTGTYATVSATATYTPLFPYPYIGSSVGLSAQAVVRIQ
jgi:Flp pilus assembly protein TadG